MLHRLGSRDFFPQLLFANLIGVYSLIMLGATVSVTDALAQCQGWPTCDGRWLILNTEPAAVAMWHRIGAAVVGVILLFTVALAVRTDTTGRVKAVLVAAVLMYPIQAFTGRLVALEGDGAIGGWLHLLVGITIFATLVVGIAWELEQRYPNGSERSTESSHAAREVPANPPHNGATSGPRLLTYFRLMKPKLMWLLCLVAAAGMVLAAGRTLDVTTIIATLGGGVIAIGASGTFNHVLERDVDQRMARTADRPLATNQIPQRNAVAFGILLTMASMSVFVLFVNLVAAALTATAILFYSVVYTIILKPHTVQNTVIGGIAGALPALIGWAAVTGQVGLPAILLALVIFCWTPAHFYNLAMAYREDYEAGGFPMLPVVRGDQVARKHIMYWAGATMAAAVALAATGRVGSLYALVAIAGGILFLVMINRLHVAATRRAALRTFHASNAYLGSLLLVMTVDVLVFV